VSAWPAAARRIAPPDDIGGVFGYAAALAAAADRTHPDHAAYAAWLAPAVVGDRPDIAEINSALAAAFGV
jgi:hypothetical protein